MFKPLIEILGVLSLITSSNTAVIVIISFCLYEPFPDKGSESIVGLILSCVKVNEFAGKFVFLLVAASVKAFSGICIVLVLLRSQFSVNV